MRGRAASEGVAARYLGRHNIGNAKQHGKAVKAINQLIQDNPYAVKEHGGLNHAVCLVCNAAYLFGRIPKGKDLRANRSATVAHLW